MLSRSSANDRDFGAKKEIFASIIPLHINPLSISKLDDSVLLATATVIANDFLRTLHHST